MTRTCSKCECDFTFFNGKPGKINECISCAVDVPVYFAEQGEGDDGSVETMTKNPIKRTASIKEEEGDTQ